MKTAMNANTAKKGPARASVCYKKVNGTHVRVWHGVDLRTVVPFSNGRFFVKLFPGDNCKEEFLMEVER